MMSPGIPPSPEASQPKFDDLPAKILGEVAELAVQDIPHLKRSVLVGPVAFDSTLSQGERWKLVAEEEKVIMSAVFDVRLADVVTSPSPPRVVTWQEKQGLIEATLIGCNEYLAVAHEVTLNEDSNPVSAVTALWRGDDQAVEEFLNDRLPPTETEAGTDATSTVGRDYQKLSRLALAAAALGMATVATSYMERFSRGADTDMAPADFSARRPSAMPARPSKGKRPNIAKPPVGSWGYDEPSAAASRQRNIPIRQPKPQSGGKRGKRTSF